MRLRPVLHSALLLAMLTAGGSAFAQDNRDEIIQKLLDRVDALEREVAALQQKPGPAEVQPAPVEDVPSVNSAPSDPGSRFNFHGYADAGFVRNDDGGSTKKFDLGEIDLFATERLSAHLTALMEVVLETNNQQLVAQVPLNVERLLLQYRGNDFFNADIGSYRTAIGYYSSAYLRGSWLQTAISRPRMFTFEDDGGFLPLHAVGASINGIIPSGGLNLHYVLEGGSSRNYGDTAGIPLVDISFNRALNLAIYSQPRAVPGLEVGFSTYHDLFSPLAGIALNRSLWMAHIVYVEGRVEFLNEGLLIRLTDSPLGSATGLGFYSQIAYRIAPSWKPYARVEYLNLYGTGLIDSAARQYMPWNTVYTGGIRNDLTDSVALKLELARETQYLGTSYITAAVQVAFTF
ncbi:MAG TPA: hypothetical protein VK708_10240 [Bryobacteraceae bacterium]|nr:hypothetical protein [Bryobacteraceae bacterium]